MLTRLYIDNFRTFRNFDLKLQPLTLLVGRNGSGKTAVLDVLEKIRRLVIDGEPCESVFHAKDSSAWSEGASNQTFEVEFSSDIGSIRYRLVISFNDRRRAVIESESEHWNEKVLFETTSNGVRLPESLDENPSILSAWPKNKCFLNWRGVSYDEAFPSAFFHLSRILVASPSPVGSVGFSTEEVERPNRTLSDYVGWVRHLTQEEPGFIPKITEQLQPSIPNIHSLNLEKSGDARFLRVSFAVPNEECGEQKNYRLGYEQLSDGQRQLMMLYTLLEAVPARGEILCLDEPDNFLALSETQPWFRTLEDTVEERGGQCIVASHHPEALDRLLMTHGILLKRVGGITVCGDLKSEPFVDSVLTPSEILARGWDEP